MGMFEDIKDRLNNLRENFPEIRDETMDKIKKSGETGIEVTKELMGDISDKVNDIKAFSQVKRDLRNLKSAMDNELIELGKIVYAQAKNKPGEGDNYHLEEEIKKIYKKQLLIHEKTAEYDRLQKERSENYVIQKLSDELSEAGAIIDQMRVSAKSNIAGKLLKEIILPKEALITVVKRGSEIIIPDGNTQILAGDLVTVSGIAGDVEKVIKRLKGGK